MTELDMKMSESSLNQSIDVAVSATNLKYFIKKNPKSFESLLTEA